MGYSIEELIKEAKELNSKIESGPQNNEDRVEIEEIEKLACTLESYLKEAAPDYYEEVMEKAASASKQDLMKVASFCKVAIEKGYSETEIMEQLEKTAFRGLVPIISKGVKTVVGAPLKAAKTIAFGTEAARAAAKERKIISSAAGKIAKGRKQQYITAKVSRGAKPSRSGLKSIDQKAMRTAQAQREAAIRAKTLSGRKALGNKAPQPGFLRKMVKPALMVGGGMTAGVAAQRALNNREQEPQVSYGY